MSQYQNTSSCRLSQIFIAAVFFLLSGCLSKPVQLDSAVIQNESPQVIRDVKIVHHPTGKMGEVNMVLPHSEFELGMLQSRLAADKAKVSWIDSQGNQREAVVRIPEAPSRDKDMILIYYFDRGGGVSALLQPVAER